MHEKHVHCTAVRNRENSNEQLVTIKKLNDHVTSLQERKKTFEYDISFECEICYATFSKKSTLTTHSATVHEAQMKERSHSSVTFVALLLL